LEAGGVCGDDDYAEVGWFVDSGEVVEEAVSVVL
jgi:hypothetical protein